MILNKRQAPQEPAFLWITGDFRGYEPGCDVVPGLSGMIEAIF